MNAPDRNRQADPAIVAKLARLRARIRVYVLIHGLMLAVIWVCLSYWTALLMDYGPVLLGLNEMPRPFRMIVLLAIVGILAVILYRWVLLRVFARLRDQSLALVLERRFPELQDALATVIQNDEASEAERNDLAEAAESTGTQDPPDNELMREEMLAATGQRASEQLGQLPLRHVFNFRPLLLTGIVATLLMISITWLVAARPEIFATSLRRLYLLDQQAWPRYCHIEIVGVRIKHEIPQDVIPAIGHIKPFKDGHVTIGQASDVSVLVRAQAASDDNSVRTLPRTCEFRYRTDDGISGVLPMNKIGGLRDGYQMFALNGQILDGILSSIQFYVRGGDHRIGPFELKTVPNPVITATQIHCRYPEYMVDPQSMRWTERTVQWRTGTKLPYGTNVTIKATSNRPINQVYVLDAEGQLVTELAVGQDGNPQFAPTEFEYAIEPLIEDVRLSYLLQDRDGVISHRAQQVAIGMITDSPPNVSALLSGIGTAVTPDVQIPVSGQVSDDYGVKKAWLEIQTPVSEPISVAGAVLNDGTLEASVDFRKMQRDTEHPVTLPTTPDSQLELVVMAKDFYDLDGDAQAGQVGVGDRYVLDVVAPDRLLRILERQEVAQRRRLEQIHMEMTDARNYLVRSRSSPSSQSSGFEPGDAVSPPDGNDQDDMTLNMELRQLYVQRALLQTQKSTQEVLGVADSFADIRLQLINNRVESEDRKIRLEKSVVEPLQRIGNQKMPQLQEQLLDQDNRFQAISQGVEPQQLADAIDLGSLEAISQVDVVLVQIQEVLDSLQKFETQNELLDLVRRMIQDQELLLNRTKSERNRQAFEGLLK